MILSNQGLKLIRDNKWKLVDLLLTTVNSQIDPLGHWSNDIIVTHDLFQLRVVYVSRTESLQQSGTSLCDSI